MNYFGIVIFVVGPKQLFLDGIGWQYLPQLDVLDEDDMAIFAQVPMNCCEGR